jgi:hypothetical protein
MQFTASVCWVRRNMTPLPEESTPIRLSWQVQCVEPQRRPYFSLAIISVTAQLWTYVFWVISVYFYIRNTLPKFCPFLLGHPVCVYIYIIFSHKLWYMLLGTEFVFFIPYGQSTEWCQQIVFINVSCLLMTTDIPCIFSVNFIMR